MQSSPIPSTITAIQWRAQAALAARERDEQITQRPPPTFRGAVAAFRAYTGQECIVAGPAETGKTFGTLYTLHERMLAYPGATAGIVRKVRADMDGSVLNTWRRILTMYPAGVTVHGGSKPEWYTYPNGSVVYVGGMDRPSKILSGERDFLYVNQAEELDLDDWQTLTTRTTGRGSVAPWTQVFADCNPGPAHHWIKHRPSLAIFESRHEDNPSLYDDDGKMTAQGVRTMSVLDALVGVLKERLRYGRWVNAEGVVYEQFDPAVHVVAPFTIPDSWERIRAIDFGYRNPFVCLWIAIDPDDRMYVYRQYYHTERIVSDHATVIREASAGERYTQTIADHDAEDRATLRAEGIETTPADKRLSIGLQQVQARLGPVQRPALFIFRDSVIHPDQALINARKPADLAAEFGAYSWPKDATGRVVKEQPVKEYDHGLDALRYAVMSQTQLVVVNRPAVGGSRPSARLALR